MRYGPWTSLWRAVLCAGVAGAIALAPVAARAQMDVPVRHEWSLKAGAFVPTHSALSRQAADPWWYVGVDFNPNFVHRPLAGEVYFSADVNWREAAGHRVFSIPLSVKIKWPLVPEEAAVQAYGGLGIGAFFINTRFISGAVQPGAKFFIGAELNEDWFVELNYDWVDGLTDYTGTGIRLDGLTVLLGYRL
ncbi:MAG TPA: hypothetical protein VLH79_06680 [Chthonomonadales bacterium]|nr:hypothetical protein [Chthonomonadales bacterium]